MIRRNGWNNSSTRPTADVRRAAVAALLAITAVALLSACGGSDREEAAPTGAAANSPVATAIPMLPTSTTAAATVAPSPTTSSPTVTPAAAATPTQSPATQLPASTQAPAPTQAPSSPARSVAVAGFSFSPSVLAAPVGTVVTWTWSGDDYHNVSGAAFSSGGPAQSGKFSFTFTASGTYSYACEVHSAAGMTGTVTIQ